MQKITIQNKHNQNLAVVLEEVPHAKGIAFVMHGLGGFKEQPHVQTFAAAFREKGYTTIMFDTTNTLGESDGQYEDATVTNYYSDLEDVINWAKGQEWYQEPFFLAGHSLGGICTALYAENHPEEVKGLAPISTVVSGKLSLESPNKEDKIDEWRETGWLIKESKSKTGMMKRLKWSHMEDRLKYDLLKKVDQLTMPVLMIVGDQDDSTIPEHQQILFDAIPAEQKELHIIAGAPHTFREKAHLDEIKGYFLSWIDSIE